MWPSNCSLAAITSPLQSRGPYKRQPRHTLPQLAERIEAANMRLHLLLALTLAMLAVLQVATARVTPYQDAQHHRSTTVASFNAGLAGVPSGQPPHGGPPPKPRTTTASSSG
ncbi:uncharacterized protein LOC111598439 [Drosophila hydei]|uniref:Uncharacterized protein LOC111598439 n=1 Tax=Drosophila hydei TaxID=7224 RepID=A0A6J1LZ74_DROHY|nr:uncharacterized protein LOC111598439 [Drosophila hydei]